MSDEGWQQVRSGLTLIVWSKLASWDPQNLTLVAANEANFESSTGHKEIHRTFGRLICWIAFSVGAEYLSRGAVMLKGRSTTQASPNRILRLPSRDEDIADWIKRVNSCDPSVCEAAISFKTLGKLHPEQILPPGSERDLVSASIKLLASAIRNRDAHRYAKDVRAFHFHVVGSLFVPALNILLASLNQGELRTHLTGTEFA